MRLSLVAAVLLAVSCGGAGAVKTVPPLPPQAQDDPTTTLKSDLGRIFDDPRFERVLWSVLVKSAATSETLFSRNPAKLVMPGSNMKILVAVAAVRQFGWSYRFETKIVSTAPVIDRVLKGDLIVVGGGDPSISERSEERGILRGLAAQVHAAGIDRVEGAVIGIDDLFDDDQFGDGWSIDNIPYGYSAGVTALEYNEGSVDLIIRAGAAPGEPVAVGARPDGGELELENHLVTVSEASPGRLTLFRFPGSTHLRIDGEIPAGAAPFVRTASVPNPTEFFAIAFRNALQMEGVQVQGPGVDGDALRSKPDITAAHVLALRQSPPLSELTASMMKVSQNQYAEMLLKALGALPAPAIDAPGGSVAAGRRRVRDIFKSLAIADDSYILADGSGLSRYNYVTAETIVGLLHLMHENPADRELFEASLPVAGKDGTLARRMTGTAAEGRVRAKTGSVDNVRAISGYVETASGEALEFSVIANNFGVPASIIDALADAALVRLASFERDVRQSRSGGEPVAAADR